MTGLIIVANRKDRTFFTEVNHGGTADQKKIMVELGRPIELVCSWAVLRRAGLELTFWSISRPSPAATRQISESPLLNLEL
jgi:hypothetical protein